MFNALHLVDLVMIGLVLRLPKFVVYYGFSPGFQNKAWGAKFAMYDFLVLFFCTEQVNKRNRTAPWRLTPRRQKSDGGVIS